MRGRAQDEPLASACADLCLAVLASTLGLRARAVVRPLGKAEGAGYAFDIVAGQERPRGSHTPETVRCILVDDAAALIQNNPFLRLGAGGILAVPTAARSADAFWAELPAYVKAIAHDRRARVIGWQAPRDAGGDAAAGRWLTASAVAGLAVALAAGGTRSVDGSLVEREVADALRAAFADGAADALPSPSRRETLLAEGGKAARAAFESHVEVPRATVERDEESVRFGRKDARASVPPNK
jgi:hypothetical protein